MKSDSIVIIPTYNEKENIEKIIRAVFSLEKYFHILVIDDGSPDGTAGIVKGLIDLLALPDEEASRILVCIRNKNVHESAEICKTCGVSAVLTDALCSMINTYGPMDEVLDGMNQFIIGPDMQQAADLIYRGQIWNVTMDLTWETRRARSPG